jgi:hypothetical protein
MVWLTRIDYYYDCQQCHVLHCADMLAQRCCGQQLVRYLWLELRWNVVCCCFCCGVAAAVHGQLQQASDGGSGQLLFSWVRLQSSS